MEKRKKVPKSGPSIDKANVYFFNITRRLIDIYWLDYEGVPKHYKCLTPRCYFVSCSFAGHPWIAVDTITHNRVHIALDYVYYPPSNKPTHNYVFITIPALSLRVRSLEVIGDHLTTTEHIEQLGLPATLKDDVIQMMSNRKESFIELYKKDWTIGLPQEESDTYVIDK